MDTNRIKQQSLAAYGQWAKQWREQAKENSKHEMLDLTDYELHGLGKAILCVANGYSFEENLKEIKENLGKVDILCCDKTLGHLLDNGIEPTFCMVCDANVNYEKYLEPYKDKIKNTVLLMNVCANPKWANEQWAKKYFFVNKDVLESEKEFSSISGCKNIIPAGTNVSNAMIIMLTQSDNDGRKNFFGYDKILLIGYDYSWKHNGKYYSFDEIADNKANYMKHSYIINLAGNFAYTSGNLAFSAEWLNSYITVFKLPIINLSKDTILEGTKFGKIKEQLNYEYKKQDSEKMKMALKNLKELNLAKKNIETFITNVQRDHVLNYFATT